jgi:hypothetical protein
MLKLKLDDWAAHVAPKAIIDDFVEGNSGVVDYLLREDGNDQVSHYWLKVDMSFTVASTSAAGTLIAAVDGNLGVLPPLMPGGLKYDYDEVETSEPDPE